MKQLLEIDLPYPPTVNTYWRHIVMRGSARTLISRKGRQYRESVARVWSERNLAVTAITGRLSVVVRAHPPDNRRRDIDNLPKSLLDALTHAGVWEDDSQIDALHIFRQPVEPCGKVTVRVFQLEDGDEH